MHLKPTSSRGGGGPPGGVGRNSALSEHFSFKAAEGGRNFSDFCPAHCYLLYKMITFALKQFIFAVQLDTFALRDRKFFACGALIECKTERYIWTHYTGPRVRVNQVPHHRLPKAMSAKCRGSPRGVRRNSALSHHFSFKVGCPPRGVAHFSFNGRFHLHFSFKALCRDAII